MVTINDDAFIALVFRWNLYFFESRVKATKRDEDTIKLNSILANESLIKEKAREYLKYWRLVNPTADPLTYVIDCTREYMENTKFTNPDTTEDEYYNNTPMLFN